jgi:hypothetical protein
MAHRIRSAASAYVAPLLILLALGIATLSCDHQPTAVDDARSAGDLSGTGTIDPGAVGAVLLGSVTDSVTAPGRIEIWASNVVFDAETGVVSFDAALSNQSARTIPPPIHFVVVDIEPPDVAVVNFDGISKDGFPFYDFSAKLGSDGVLGPGERTEPVSMRFHTVRARSFAIGFRIDLGPAGGDGIVGGVVFRDDNRNGERDRCERCNEIGIPGITVALEMPLKTGEMVTLITRTDSSGVYRFAGLGAGVFKVFVAAPEDLWMVTSASPLLVTLVMGPDGRVQSFLGANFGLYPVVPPVSETLFGPILVGPPTPYGTELDSTFVNPPSPLAVVFSYYLEVVEPPFEGPFPVVIDHAAAWIDDELVFEYLRQADPDTAYFAPRRVRIRDGLVKVGENAIRIVTEGNEHAALVWRVFRRP